MSTRAQVVGDVQTTVSALILSNEAEPRIVLLKHKRYGVWMQPGGHVEVGESSVQSLIREVREETGIDIASQLAPTHLREGVLALPPPDWMFSYDIRMDDEPDHVHIDHLYRVVVPYQVLRPAKRESQDIGWWRSEELGGLELFDGNREFFRKVISTVKKV